MLGAGYSVSAFTRWGEDMDMVWVKSRTGRAGARPARHARRRSSTTRSRASAPRAARRSSACPARGRTGCRTSGWSSRRANGEEIQSEYFVARERADEAIAAMREVGPRIRDLLQVCELRTIAADELWLSPQYGQDTFAIHFTWRRDQAARRARARARRGGAAAARRAPALGQALPRPARATSGSRTSSRSAPLGPARRVPQRLDAGEPTRGRVARATTGRSPRARTAGRRPCWRPSPRPPSTRPPRRAAAPGPPG